MPPADEQQMARMLTGHSFSRIAQYWRHFEADPTTHQFKPGTTVAEIAELYDFDARLRQISSEGLSVFEIALRSRLGYQIATVIDPYRYLDPNIYMPRTIRRGTTIVRLRDELIVDLHRDLDRSKEDFISAYHRRGDLPPLWMAMEVFSLGSVSKMYRLLAHQTIRRDTAYDFGYPNPAFAESVFHSLTVLRNVCAHHARFWNRTNIQIAPRVLNRLKNDSDQTIYQSTPWAWLVVLADVIDTIQADNSYSQQLWAHIRAYPQYADGLKHPKTV
ncbi:MAG: Abi family protein [Propionibacteriaceae bacterium]|nr:Abi family protein [Propionibacteriaceae bacterium]